MKKKEYCTFICIQSTVNQIPVDGNFRTTIWVLVHFVLLLQLLSRAGCCVQILLQSSKSLFDVSVVMDTNAREESKIPTFYKNVLKSVSHEKWLVAESCGLTFLESKGLFILAALHRESVIDTRCVFEI